GAGRAEEDEGGDRRHPEEEALPPEASALLGEERQEGGEEGGAAGEGGGVLVDVLVPPVGAEAVVAIGVGGGDGQEPRGGPQVAQAALGRGPPALEDRLGKDLP